MIEKVIDILELMYEHHDKNLTLTQKQLLCNALKLLKAMKNKETFEAWYEDKSNVSHN